MDADDSRSGMLVCEPVCDQESCEPHDLWLYRHALPTWSLFFFFGRCTVVNDISSWVSVDNVPMDTRAP